jgi:lantibiotic transport system permease protein
VNVHLMILMFIMLFNFLIFMVALTVNFLYPSLNFLEVPIRWSEWLRRNSTMYVAGLSISAIQFWVGLRFRNFFVPVGIGFAMWIIGTLMVMEFGTRHGYLFPYTALPYSLFDKYKHLMPAVNLVSVGYAALFLLIGFLDFRRGKK